MLPNFLGIGVQRAATTWIFECLKEHPQIFLPAQKEVHFFDENFDKGLNWYESFFSDVTDEIAIGEITPDYLYNRKAVERIASVLPNAKLIVSLRNPVDRAYSAYKLLSGTVYKDISFDEAFWQKGYIREVGFYYKHLTYLYNFFSKNQVLVFLYDDILISPEHVLKNIYVFLEVDSSFQPSALTKKYNKILFPTLQRFLVRVGLENFLVFVKKSKYGDWLKRLVFYLENRKRIRPFKLNYSDYIDAYKEDILRLERLINRDLSIWLKAD